MTGQMKSSRWVVPFVLLCGTSVWGQESQTPAKPESLFLRVEVGQTLAQVHALLGIPTQVQVPQRGYLMEQWISPHEIIDVRFKKGKVVNMHHSDPNPPRTPLLLHRVDPEFPEEARTSKEKTVVLLVQVDSSGKAASMRVLNSLGLNLDEKAMEVVRQWEWSPGTVDNKAVMMEARAEVTFLSPEFKFAQRQLQAANLSYASAYNNFASAAAEYNRLRGDYQGRELVSSITDLFGHSTLNDAVNSVQQQANINRQSQLASQADGLRAQLSAAYAAVQTLNLRMQNADTCSLVYHTTANQKVVDLTVGDQQKITACQNLSLYPPPVE